MNKTNISARKIIFISIMERNIDFIFPEQVCLTLNGNNISKDKPIDIGSKASSVQVRSER